MRIVVSHQPKGIKSGAARRRRPVARAVLAAAALSAAGVLTACQPPPDNPMVIVVAASATSNEAAPVLAGPDRALLRGAGQASTRATAFVVNPNTGQARQVSLTPRRADGEVDYGPDRSGKLAASVNRVQQLLDTLTDRQPFDLLTMMAQAVRVTPRPGTLLVLSSGLSTAGGFDVRQVGWGAEPRAAAESLDRQGLLPRLAGWNVIFSGLADSAGRQPALPVPQRTTLTSYWLALCQVAGAASCTVDAVTRAEPPSRSTTPVPVVRFPEVTSFRGPHGAQTTNVPADAFFTFGSAKLLPGADAILQPLAVKARGQHLKVTITGYASPDGGSAAYNLGLSAGRARAVRARLVALGTPAGLIVSAAGAGTAGQPRSACYRDGRLDEAICAQLRRVLITLAPGPAGA
jgi:outer membrane protein OmpA-like peptidoglycan-associated protein